MVHPTNWTIANEWQCEDPYLGEVDIVLPWSNAWHRSMGERYLVRVGLLYDGHSPIRGTWDILAMLQGLLLHRPSRRVSFADALIWAAARSTDEKVAYSLDERFPGEGVEVRS